jgi:hypothetical protein
MGRPLAVIAARVSDLKTRGEASRLLEQQGWTREASSTVYVNLDGTYEVAVVSTTGSEEGSTPAIELRFAEHGR